MARITRSNRAALKFGASRSAQVAGGLFAGVICLLCGASIADDAAVPSSTSSSAFAAPVSNTTTASAVAAPSRHQLMKDCMSKQVAADSGKPRSELRSTCRDLTSTEKENADAALKAEQR